MQFLGCWRGEFVQQSRVSLVGDHSLYSHDLNVWYRDDIVGRNLMLVTLRVQRVTWKVVVFVTGKDVKDLHQISPHHCLNKELLLRLQQGSVLVNFSQVWNFFKSYLDTVFFSGIRSRFSDLGLVPIVAGEGVFSLLICLFVRLLF